jgi:predicted DNA-binding protein
MSTATMHRTQIYLTPEERDELRIMAARTGRTRSDLIREALDRFLRDEAIEGTDRTTLLRHGRGLWKDREDLPDFESLRREWDRPLDSR